MASKGCNEWIGVENKFLGDKAIVDMVNGNKMTFSRYQINKPVEIPMHYHDYEQIVYVTDGVMTLTVEGVDYVIKKGDVFVILSNEEHSASITGVPFESLETYSPVRTDMPIKEK